MLRATLTITVYSYDVLNRVTREEVPWPAHFNIPGTLLNTYAYDNCVNGKGRICQITDHSGSTSFSYSNSSEIVAQTNTIEGVSYTMAYTYDAAGRLSNVSYPNGVELRYGYTAAHQVHKVEAKLNGVWQVVADTI